MKKLVLLIVFALLTSVGRGYAEGPQKVQIPSWRNLKNTSYECSFREIGGREETISVTLFSETNLAVAEGDVHDSDHPIANVTSCLNTVLNRLGFRVLSASLQYKETGWGYNYVKVLAVVTPKAKRK